MDQEAAVAELGSGSGHRRRSAFLRRTNDRLFRAFDAKTGDILWQYPTLSGVNGVPVSFAVDGTQYIAVPVGLGCPMRRGCSAGSTCCSRKISGGAARRRVYVFAVK